MTEINPQAEKLNKTIEENNPVIYNLLSRAGKAAFFPTGGILAQTAQAKKVKNKAVIGMAIKDNGEPMVPKSLAKMINLDPKRAFLYAPSQGIPELRTKWQEMIKQKNPSLEGMISLPIVTAGLTHGINRVIKLFVDEGEKVILTDKFWGNYKLIFQDAAWAVPNPFNTFKGDSFDIDSFKKKLAEEKGKRVLLLNFPNNPSGYTCTDDEAKKIIDVIKESAEAGNHIVAITDDAYFGLVYKEGIYKESLFSKLANLHENVLAVKVDGATKEDGFWGARVGFVTYAYKGITEDVCKALEDKLAGSIRGNNSNGPRGPQEMLKDFYESDSYEAEKREFYDYLKKRFDKVEETLKDEKFKEYFSALPYNSGYFMCLEVKEGLDAEKVRLTLLDSYDTGVISMQNKLLRIAFSSIATDDIPELFENIYSACKDQ